MVPMTLQRLGILDISKSWWHNFVLVPQSVMFNSQGDPLTIWRPSVVWSRDLTSDLPCYARLMEQGTKGFFGIFYPPFARLIVMEQGIRWGCLFLIGNMFG